MSKKAITFTDEIKSLKSLIETTKEELEALLGRRKSFHVETQALRDSISALRNSALEGGQQSQSASPEVQTTSKKKQSKKEPGKKSSVKIEALELNPETGKPFRGARIKQVTQIVKQLGRGGKEFRNIDVIRAIKDVEPDLSDSTKSYIYIIMNNLTSDGVVEKVRRGYWKLL